MRVDDAEGAQGEAIRGSERSTRVEADGRLAGDERVVGEARVLRRVEHDQHFGRVERVGAEGDLAVGLPHVQAVAGFEPLALGVHQTDEGNRRTQQGAGELGDAVEGGFGEGVEDVVALERGESRGFCCWIVLRLPGHAA